MLNIPLLVGSRAAALDLNFLTGSLSPLVTFSRASSATDSLYTDAAGSSFNTFTSGVARMLTAGLLIEEARTQLLLNSAVPVTQTTASLATGTYVFWCIGTGSVTSSAGTATATGLGAITGSQGTFQTITVTVAGTLTFTVSGSINRFQLELGAFPTSFISTAGATATRSADVATVATSAFAWNAATGAIISQFIVGASNAGGRIIGQGSGGVGGEELPQIMGATSPYAIEFSDGNGHSINPANTAAFGAVAKAGVAWSVGSSSGVFNGGTVVTGAGWVAFTFSSLGLMARNGGATNPLGKGWFQRLRIFNQRLPDAQLQALTQ